MFRSRYTGTLANRGVAVAPYHDLSGRVPAKLRAAQARIEEKIENGTRIPATHQPGMTRQSTLTSLCTPNWESGPQLHIAMGLHLAAPNRRSGGTRARDRITLSDWR